MDFNRREALSLAGALAFLGTFGLRPALADAEALEQRLQEFTGGRMPEQGRITLDLPEVAENGNAVSVAFTVDGETHGEDRVEAVIVLAEGNPNPDVATFHFTPLSGTASATTRMRLATSQNVVAVARMADGSVWMDRKAIEVAVGGCTG